jgi:predicted nucleotidyltransferase
MVATETELDRAIADFVQRLEAGIRVEAIVLYGSYARGTAYEQSDIDVAVISPDFNGLPMYKRQERIALLTLYRDLRITPIGYSSAEYARHDPASFLREIIRTGRVVYEGPSSSE